MKCVQCHRELVEKRTYHWPEGANEPESEVFCYYCNNSSMYTVRGVGEDGKETDIPHRCPMYHALQIGE